MRIRVKYQKGVPLRFTSALDIQQIWERTLRRSGISIVYSQGFHPQPKIQLGLPLPLGFISDEEFVDIWLQGEDDINPLPKRIALNLPDGLTITSVVEIDPIQKPLVTQITTSEYLVRFWDEKIDIADLNKNISHLLEQKEVLRKKRNNKEYDLRPLIFDLASIPEDQSHQGYLLSMKLSSAQNRMGRADDVMSALGFSINQYLVKRLLSY